MGCSLTTSQEMSCAGAMVVARGEAGLWLA